MLQALQNEEQKTNQKMQQKQVKVTNVKIEKDWWYPERISTENVFAKKI